MFCRRMVRLWRTLVVGILAVSVGVCSAAGENAAVEIPRVNDDDLEMKLFAKAPLIVHPIGAVVDQQGRLLVIESHTHFRPADYEGPQTDKIVILTDTDGDGDADARQTFFSGTTHTMGIAVHPDGAIYLATRNEILRLEDNDHDGLAEKSRRIVFLETEGAYPHNGLSGLEFDLLGNLFFGMGENLGAEYTLHGADGRKIHDQAEGGNIFFCTAGGEKLRRIATGFWNPFGVCRDIHGRMFAVDNDPSATGCRLLHVVEGGNYGYQYRYGRSGLHPFVSWRGGLPGSLPMVSYVGEGPCELISYESNGFPERYRGRLLTACWSEHRLESFELRPEGASFRATRTSLVQGGEDFRPVGIAVDHEGALFLTDWVKKDYNLHGHGRVWRLQGKTSKTAAQNIVPASNYPIGMLSPQRRLREQAVRRALAQDKVSFLWALSREPGNIRARAAALEALLTVSPLPDDVKQVATNDPSPAMRAQAIRGLAKRGELDFIRQHFFQDGQAAEIELAALPARNRPADAAILSDSLAHDDPFIRSAAIHQLAAAPKLLQRLDNAPPPKSALARANLMLAHRRSGRANVQLVLKQALQDQDPLVQFMAVKWIADERLQSFRPQMKRGLDQAGVSPDLFMAYATALARIDGQSGDEQKVLAAMTPRLAIADVAPALKVMILRGVSTLAERGRESKVRLKLAALRPLLQAHDAALKLEAVRFLAASLLEGRDTLLAAIAQDENAAESVRCQAILGLAPQAESHQDLLLEQAASASEPRAEEALRALLNVGLNAKQKRLLEEIGRSHPRRAELTARLLKPAAANASQAPPEAAALLKRLQQAGRLEAGRAEVGRRIFENAKVAKCAGCHMNEGRGSRVGPDLTAIGRQSERAVILESILQPNKNVAPHYVAWRILTAEGRIHTGFLVQQTQEDQTYIDDQGQTFTLLNQDIETTDSLSTSIMPTGLLANLTDQEIVDLLAYLTVKR